MKKPRHKENNDSETRIDDVSEREQEQDTEQEDVETESGQIEDTSPGSLSGEGGAAPDGEGETAGKGDVCDVIHRLDRKTGRVRLIVGPGCKVKDVMTILSQEAEIEDLEVPKDFADDDDGKAAVHEEAGEYEEDGGEENYDEDEGEDEEEADDEPEDEDQELGDVPPDARKVRTKK